MSTYPLARKPFARLPGDTKADLNFQALEVMLKGMFAPKVITHTQSPYTVQPSDWHLVCDCTLGAVVLTFQLASQVDGFPVIVTKSDATANTVTLTGTFSGVVNPTMGNQYQSKVINAANGAYIVTPGLTAAEIASGTFPGNYIITGTLSVLKALMVRGLNSTPTVGIDTSADTVSIGIGATAVIATMTYGSLQIFERLSSGQSCDVSINNGVANIMWQSGAAFGTVAAPSAINVLVAGSTVSLQNLAGAPLLVSGPTFKAF